MVQRLIIRQKQWSPSSTSMTSIFTLLLSIMNIHPIVQGKVSRYLLKGEDENMITYCVHCKVHVIVLSQNRHEQPAHTYWGRNQWTPPTNMGPLYTSFLPTFTGFAFSLLPFCSQQENLCPHKLVAVDGVCTFTVAHHQYVWAAYKSTSQTPKLQYENVNLFLTTVLQFTPKYTHTWPLPIASFQLPLTLLTRVLCDYFPPWSFWQWRLYVLYVYKFSKLALVERRFQFLDPGM